MTLFLLLNIAVGGFLRKAQCLTTFSQANVKGDNLMGKLNV